MPSLRARPTAPYWRAVLPLLPKMTYNHAIWYFTCSCGMHLGLSTVRCCVCGKEHRKPDGRTWSKDRKLAMARRRAIKHIDAAIAIMKRAQR